MTVTVVGAFGATGCAAEALPCLMPSPAPSTLHKIKVSPRGATRLKTGHVWVYRSDIVSANNVPPGSLVAVTDQRGKPLGTALYSSSSQIAIRLIANEIGRAHV